MNDERFDAVDNAPSSADIALMRFNQQKKKNIVRIVASVVAFAFISIVFLSVQSLAYFSDKIESGSNKISSGNVEINLIETVGDVQSGQASHTEPISIMPASSVSQTVTVKNSGSLSVYVRVSLEKIVNDPTGLPIGWEDKISCNINLADWQFIDGYYYYNRVLSPGQTTVALFDKVSFAASMGNEFVNKSVVITVVAEAVQVGSNGSSASDAVGWPS